MSGTAYWLKITMFWCCVYRGWWNWYHGRPVGGTAVWCCFQEKERTSASRYTYICTPVNHKKAHVDVSKCHVVSWFTLFRFFPGTFVVWILYHNTCSIWDSFVPSSCSLVSPYFCQCTTTDLFVFLSLLHILLGSGTMGYGNIHLP